MRPISTSLLSIPILLVSLTSAVNLDCKDIRLDGKKWNFGEIGGPHSVTIIDKTRPPSIYNTTWTVDICQRLDKHPDIKPEDQCKTGTFVCGIERAYNPVDDPDRKGLKNVLSVIPVAGNYHASESKGLDPHYERLKATDSGLEGLEISLNGGTFNNKKQRAEIQFICDRDRTGNEGKSNTGSKIKRSDDDDDDEGSDGDETNSLKFISYGPTGATNDVDILNLQWRTKYACEDFDKNVPKKGGWGFFTWFILLFFLGTAAYLIFGSWLNYNRYGARGWDLLPHGDTIRDVPYLVKDWSRKVIDTVSGSGTRGGYSAV